MDVQRLSPRQRAGSLGLNGYATERSKQICAARLLCRSSELLHVSRAFSAWAAATRERKLKGHMNRCSIMMKHTTMRQDYSRFFLRWLAFTQSRTFAIYRRTIQLRQDVPLRSKADFVALARCYFAKWRTHLREKKQRMTTNVDLLAALNRERLRSRTLLRWWLLYHSNATRRHDLEIREHEDTIHRLQAEVRKAVNEAEMLRDRLTAAQQTQERLQEALDASRDDCDGSRNRQQAEISALRDSMRAVIEMVEGGGGPSMKSLRKWGVATSPMLTSSPPTNVGVVNAGSTLSSHTPTQELPPLPPVVSTAAADSLASSAQYSKDVQAALLRSVNSVIVALADLSHSSAVPLSIEESLRNLRHRLDDDAEELASVKADRDELAAAAMGARLVFASATASLGTTANSLVDSEQQVSRAASAGSTRMGPGGASSNASGVRASPSRADCKELPRLLVADAKTVASTVQSLRKSEEQAMEEVRDLQDAALRAIDALGGSTVDNEGLAASPDETTESRAQRSSTIAVGLRNLCEDMIVVLVLTSLWSGKRASERVSEALERLWHRTQDLEANHAEFLQRQEDLVKVVHVAARLLRPPPQLPASAAPTPRGGATSRERAAAALARRRHTQRRPEEEGPPTAEEVDEARRCADTLATSGDDPQPAELLKRCEEASRKASTQSTILTSELESLLQSSQDLLEATVGTDEAGASRSAADLSVSSRDQLNDDSAMSIASPSTQEVALALRAAARKVARVVAKAGDGTNAPLLIAMQGVLDQLEQAKRECAEATSQARTAERARKKELDEHARAHKAAEKELQQRLKAVERELEQQTQDKRRGEKEIQILQSEMNASATALEKAKAAHAKTQVALEAQLKAAASDSQASSAAMTKLQEECRLAEDEKKRLEETLQAAKRENEKWAVQVDTLKKQLESAELQRTSSSAKAQQLQDRLNELEKQRTASDATGRALADQLAEAKEANEAAAAARAQLEQRLLIIEGENRVNNAVGVFLRDVLRDALTRLHLLSCSIGDTEPLSPPTSLTLQQAGNTPPPPLTHDSDPSDYVEYILRLDGNDSTGKRLVQEHLRENSVLHGVKEPSLTAGKGDATATSASKTASAAAAAVPPEALTAPASTASADAANPSTWEVVAELHDRLVLLYERVAQLDQTAADQLALNGKLSSERDQLCADVLATLQQLQPWSSAASAATHAAPKALLSRSSLLSAPAAVVNVPAATTVAAAVAPREAVQSSSSTSTSTTAAAALQLGVVGPALQASASEVVQALGALQLAADSVRPLVQPRSPKSSATAASDDAASTEHLKALVADVKDMASCLQRFSESVQHGIVALGGAAAGDEVDGDVDAPLSVSHTLPGINSSNGVNGNPSAAGSAPTFGGKNGLSLDSQALATRLEALCEETGTSILEVRRLLLGEDGTSATGSGVPQSPSKPLKLGDVIPQIRAKMAELEEVKRESARLLKGLNRAFDDDEESLFAGSVSSSQSRSLRPKKKPLPAFQGTPEAGLRLMQQEMKGKKGRRTEAPSPDGANLMASFGSRMRDRLGDVQNLRLVCHNTLQVLEGRPSTEESGQFPSYGEALVTLLTTQVEDLKQALVESEPALKGYRNDLRNVTVGTRLHLLADVVKSLKLERDSLKEDINRRARQSNMLLDDLNKEVKALQVELASHQQAKAELTTAKDAVTVELDAQKRSATQLATRLAQLQHESNVLTAALAKVLHALPASPYNGVPTSSVEKSVQNALKVGQGDALTSTVEEALQAAAQHQQRLRDAFHSRLASVKSDVQGLQELVSQSWTQYGAPMAAAAAQLVAETTEVLTLENDMLRPRAVEREKLKCEVAALETTLVGAKEDRDTAMQRLRQLDDENMRLRRALRDAEMAQVLSGAKDDATNAAAASSCQLDSRAVEWERRMIAGATDLAMDAIDSMSGQSISAVFGSITEETLRVYKGVRESLCGVVRACEAARGTDGRLLWVEVEAYLHELDALEDSADFLRTRLPLLYRASSR